MYLRSAPTTTLDDVREAVAVNYETIQRAGTAVRIHLTADDPAERQIEFRESEITIPATEGSVQALGEWLDIPGKFLQRLDGGMKEHLINGLLEKKPEPGNFRFTDQGIQAVRDPRKMGIEADQIVRRIAKVMPGESMVIDWANTSADFNMDLVVPLDFDSGIGGDPEVGDLTHGGLRTGIDLRHSTSPWVQPYMYRLVCTNGMEAEDDGLRIDSRGGTVEDTLNEFEAIADRAFREVENQIRDFYALRNERVENAERTLLRMAEERGLPDRTRLRLAERVPSLGDEDGNVSMFDLVNLITNQANAPGTRPGARRTIERAGGAIVTSHVERCGHCRSSLN